MRLGIGLSLTHSWGSGGGGGPFSSANTVLLVEGDSNTSWDFRKTNWLRHALIRTIGRYWLPPGGNFANAGATASANTVPDGNSMEERQASFVAYCQAWRDRGFQVLAAHLIGTNFDGQGLAHTQSRLTSWHSAVRATGAKVLAIGVYPQTGDTPPDNRSNLVDWLAAEKAAGRVDYFFNSRDPAGANITGADMADGTHLSTTGANCGDYKLGVAFAAYLNSLSSTSDIYDVNPTSLVDGDLGGTGGTLTNSSGAAADGWTLNRSAGDHTVTGSVVTSGLDGRRTQRITVANNGTVTSTVRFERTFTLDHAAGECWDTFALVQMVSGGPFVTAFLTSQPNNAASSDHMDFPANTGTALELVNWGGEAVLWRGYAGTSAASPNPANASIQAAATNVLIRFQFQVGAGNGFVFDIADVRHLRRAMPLVTATLSKTLGAMSLSASAIVYSAATATLSASLRGMGLTADGSVSNGVVVNADLSTSLRGMSLTAGAGVVSPILADLSASLRGTLLTADGTVTSVSAPAWDSTLTASGQLVYSNSDRTVTATSPSGARYGRALVGKASGKWYFKATLTGAATGRGLGIGTSVVGGNTGGTTGTTRWWWTGATAFTDSANQSMSTNLGTADGDYEVAFDLDADLIWFKGAGIDWNNTVGADPATGTGGLSIVDVAGATIYPIVGLPNSNGSLATFITGTPPSGFTAL